MHKSKLKTKNLKQKSRISENISKFSFQHFCVLLKYFMTFDELVELEGEISLVEMMVEAVFQLVVAVRILACSASSLLFTCLLFLFFTH